MIRLFQNFIAMFPVKPLLPEELNGVLAYQERLARRHEPNYLLGSAGSTNKCQLVRSHATGGWQSLVNVEIGVEKIEPRKLKCQS